MASNVASNGGRAARPHGPRASKVDVHQRVALAERLLGERRTRAEIVATMCGTFGVSARAADRAIARARELAEISDAKRRESFRVEVVKRLDSLSKKAEKKGAFAACVGAERLKIDVLGLRAPSELEVKAAVQAVPSESREISLADALEELEAIGEILNAARPMLMAKASNGLSAV